MTGYESDATTAATNGHTPETNHPVAERTALTGSADTKSGYPKMSESTYRSTSVPAKLRERVLERDGHECQYCGASEDGVAKELHAHHITPVSNDGPDTLDNLTTLCQRCHGAIHGSQERDEYPIELLNDIPLRDRTPERYDSRLLECQQCGYTWEYTGDKASGLVTGCPSCPTKVRIRKKKTLSEMFTFDLEELVREKAIEEGFDPEAFEVDSSGTDDKFGQLYVSVEGVSREGFGEVEWNGDTYAHGEGPNGREVRIPEKEP